MSGMQIQRVALLHGVLMSRATMWPLAARLRKAGFSVSLVGYPSVLGGDGPALDSVAEKLRDADAVVAHSLGGLMTLEALRRMPESRLKRLVCLGSPLNGSAVARMLDAHRWTRPVLGRSMALLLRGAAPDGRVQVGVIAGTVPRGAGRVIARLPAPHDGTVSVAETRASGLADHVEVPASHVGLLLSREAAAQAIHFLRSGRFSRA